MKPLNQPNTWRRTRRAVRRVAVATVLAAPIVVAGAEVAHARIVVNHNEVAGRDA